MADIRFLGTPAIAGAGLEETPSSTEARKRVALLAYLCLNLPLRLHTDTELAALLWPNVPRAEGERRVAGAVRALNGSRSEPLVQTTRYGEYGVVQPAVSVDAWAFRGGMRMRRYEDALTMVRGELLAGLDLPDASPFMEWLGRQRARYRRLASVCALRAHRAAMARGEGGLAAGFVVLAYRSSPDGSALLPRVMERLDEVGAPEEAMRLFHELSDPPPRAVSVARRLDPARAEPPVPRAHRRGRVWLNLAGALVLAAAAVALPSVIPGRDAAPIPPREATRAAPGPGSRPAPPPPAAIWELANRHFARGSYEEAALLYRLLAHDPRYGEASHTRAFLIHTALRDTTDASWARAGGPYRDSTRALAADALLALHGGDGAAASALAEPPGPGDPDLVWLARIYGALRGGEIARAHALVLQAPDTVFAPTEGPLRRALVLGWTADALGEPEAARGHYRTVADAAEAALEQAPEDPWVLRNLALARTGLGELEEAGHALGRADASARGSPDPFLRYKLMEARALLLGGSSPGGVALVRELLTARYPWPLTREQLAWDPRWRSYDPGVTTAPPGPGP